MEPLLETIDLDIEESNELKFKIKLEGKVSSPAKVRLVCEGSDFSYVFNGYGTGEMDVVQFNLPRMDNKIKEGLYNAKVEVLVENRYFAPLQFQLNFKKSVSIVAEAIRVVPRIEEQSIKVTAAPIVVSKASTNSIQFERKQVTEEEKNLSESTTSKANEPARKKLASKQEEKPKEQSKFMSLKEAYLSKKNKSSF